MAEPKRWQFAVPSLPKKVYSFVQEFSGDEGVSYWHTVLMGLLLLARLPTEDREALKEEVTKKFPYPGSKSCR